MQPDVGRRSADFNNEPTRLYVPLTLSLVGIESKLLQAQTASHGTGLSRLKAYAGKSLQLDGTDLLGRIRGRNINLGDFVCLHLARVFHVE